MPRATCRCGQKLSFPADGPDRVICPKCSAKIRVRPRDAAAPAEPEGPAAGQDEGDGFVRFACECGRRLKVRLTSALPEAGQCPDCGRVVPVPASAVAAAKPAPTQASRPSGPESPTQEMSVSDLADLERWSAGHLAKGKGAASGRNDDGNGSGLSRAVAGNGVPSTVDVGVENDLRNTPTPPANPALVKAEVGLRVCPRCGRPIHLGADTCRQCGAHVPRR